MAQSTLKPIGLYEPGNQFHLRHPDGKNPQDTTDLNHQTASILRDIVTEQNGNTNPTYQTTLCLMELRAALENRYLFVDIRYETMATTRNIEDAMFISEKFLQSITDLDGTFQKARDYDESVTFRSLSAMIDSTEEATDEAWLHAKEIIDSCVEDDTQQALYNPSHLKETPTSLRSTLTISLPEHNTDQGEISERTEQHHTPYTSISCVDTTTIDEITDRNDPSNNHTLGTAHKFTRIYGTI